MRLDPVSDLLSTQQGVTSRAQLLARGVTPAQVETCLRRGDLVAIHPGTYVTHTGSPTWEQRAWAATLYAGRSALHLAAALHDRSGGKPPTGPIDVAVCWTRRVAPQPGLRIHRVRGLEAKVRWNLSPPRVRLEVAAVEVAHRAGDDLAAISALAGIVGARRTRSDRLRDAIDDRARLRRRTLLTTLLADLEAGTHSVLEHGFLDRVVRPHGLPEPTQRQAPRQGLEGVEYRDIEYGPHLVLELDGRQHDTSEARDADADRDLDDLADGSVVPRLRYRQVFGSPCRTAQRLARLLTRHGWEGDPRPCEDPDCDIRTAGKDVRK